MHTTIIVDEAHGDSAAEAIAGVLRKRGTASIVTLAKYLAYVGVVFAEETGYLVRSEAAESRQSNGIPHAVCNRVVQISAETASALDGHRDVLMPNIVLAEYARALAEEPKVWGALGAYPSGHMLPLNLQWRSVAGRLQGIEVPRFAYGFGAEDVDVSGFDAPLWKSPFDLYGWQSVADTTRPELHAFVVDKPVGEPVVAYFVGTTHDAFQLRSDGVPLSDDVMVRLNASVAVIALAFGAFMGEVLFFVDGPRVVFAAFSPYMKTSFAHQSFASVLERGLA